MHPLTDDLIKILCVALQHLVSEPSKKEKRQHCCTQADKDGRFKQRRGLRYILRAGCLLVIFWHCVRLR